MKKTAVFVVAGLAIAVALALAAWRCMPRGEPEHPSPMDVLTPTAGIPWFEGVAEKAGIDFRHYNAETSHNYIIETLGSGIAWIDYDNDGWLDLFCLQDGQLPPGKVNSQAPTNKLFRNNGNGVFEDVTEKVRLARAGYHLGCAVGDFDNDGYDDLAVTCLGGIVLYKNKSDGKNGRRFVNVTGKAGGLRNPHTATSCAWGDIDGDGFLDLYVCNYVEIDLDNHNDCELIIDGKRVSVQCSPNVYPHTTHKLFRNNRNGTFTDISKASGIADVKPRPGLGVVMCDLDGDGKLDIYVANDLQQAYLFHNLGNGRFEEKALWGGCGYTSFGSKMAGMGVDASDVDGSGRPSLFVTNFQKQPNILFLNLGKMRFRDILERSRLGMPSMNRLGFGTVFFDADLDGLVDVAVANGHVQRYSKLISGTEFAQRDQLFLGAGNARFRDVSEKAGLYFHDKYVSRGMAAGDFDNDGRPDLAISTLAGPIVLLRNATKNQNNWLVLELDGDGQKSNRNAIGARIEIKTDDSKQVRFLNGGGSYLSANSRRIHVGLGKAKRAREVVVIWPSGRRQVYANLEGGKFWQLREGMPEAKILR